jgi:hypothetical protein
MFVDSKGLDRYTYNIENEILYYYEDGNPYIPVEAWEASLSGQWGLGPLPPGKYKINPPLTLANTVKNSSYCDNAGNCWWAGLEAEFDLNGRSGFGIHPDGGEYGGTLGCIGLTNWDTNSIYQHLGEHNNAALLVY